MLFFVNLNLDEEKIVKIPKQMNSYCDQETFNRKLIIKETDILDEFLPSNFPAKLPTF